jgi:flagellar hook-basal body complex protein FliE
MDGIGSLGAALGPQSLAAAVVPDGPSETPIVTPLPPLSTIDGADAGATAGLAGVQPAGNVEGKSFGETLMSYLGEVNDKMTTSDKDVRDLASGKENDPQKVVQSVEEANLAFQFTMAMRTKLLTAYQDISRMQV